MKTLLRKKPQNIAANPYDNEDDVWFDEAALKDDIIEGVLNKFDSIEDDIWAKVILMEKNKMVGKAYIRSPILTVNGSGMAFDGEGIGLFGFNNTTRDSDTRMVLSQVKEGCRIKMDDLGNIIVKSFCKEKIICKGSSPKMFEVSIGKPRVLFDMGKFQIIMNEELKKDVPDWEWLRLHTITSMAFVEGMVASLKQPVWLMVINIVALDLLRTKAASRSVSKDSTDFAEIIDEEQYSEDEDGMCMNEEATHTEQQEIENQMLGHPGVWHRVEYSSNGKEALI